MRIFTKHTFYILSSFLAGFSVMTVELISGRIVAPIIGSSVFTWTSVIGITLLGLAIGSYVGGQIADRAENNKALPLTFLISSILVSLIPLLAANTNFITDSSDSILTLNLYLSLYLFLLPTFAIGLIQPIILKKFANDFSKIGSEYGILSFAWSAGGILGVFLTGFFFISNIGSRETIWLMSFVLFFVGGIFALKNKKIILLFLVTLIVMPIILYITQQKILNPKIVFEKETNYYDARVIDSDLPSYGKSRILALDFDFHSVEPEKKAEDYPEMYPVFGNLKQDIKNILVIGAGAYTMPKYFKNYYKNANVSVVEVDPEMINIGNNFFNLKKYDIKTVAGDAKIVINKDKEKYDVIFGDAYNSFISVPWYLLTKEWNDEVKEKLNDNGIYAINFIGSLSGTKSEFTNSVLNTFKISFPNFYIFAFGTNPEYTQNVTLVGIKGNLPINEEELIKKLSVGENSFLAEKIVPVLSFKNYPSVILTDNFSPVEKLMEPTIESYFPKNLFEIKSVLSI
ncbi:MAG: fused MFS/spermidine synthase [Candidatus Paceibacterota bacterium]|jgi:spermidine synthase